MKRFIRTDNDRIIKLEGLVFIGPIKERYPQQLTPDTRFDEDGKPLPIFYFDVVYNNSFVITLEYENIEEADQDREKLLNELNEN